MKILIKAILPPILLVTNNNMQVTNRIYKSEINQNFINNNIYFCKDDYDCSDNMICVKLLKYGICQIDKKKRKLIPIYLPIPID